MKQVVCDNCHLVIDSYLAGVQHNFIVHKSGPYTIRSTFSLDKTESQLDLCSSCMEQFLTDGVVD